MLIQKASTIDGCFVAEVDFSVCVFRLRLVLFDT